MGIRILDDIMQDMFTPTGAYIQSIEKKHFANRLECDWNIYYLILAGF